MPPPRSRVRHDLVESLQCRRVLTIPDEIPDLLVQHSVGGDRQESVHHRTLRQHQEVTLHRARRSPLSRLQPDLPAFRLLCHRLGGRQRRYRILCRRSAKRGVKIIPASFSRCRTWSAVDVARPRGRLPLCRLLRSLVGIPTGFPFSLLSFGYRRERHLLLSSPS